MWLHSMQALARKGPGHVGPSGTSGDKITKKRLSTMSFQISGKQLQAEGGKNAEGRGWLPGISSLGSEGWAQSGGTEYAEENSDLGRESLISQGCYQVAHSWPSP